MIKELCLNKFGPLNDVKWDNLKNINVMVGKNSTGKTMALKALYASLKSLEEQGLGNDNRLLKEILSDKLYWTFQPGDAGLGALVNTEYNEPLKFNMKEDDCDFEFAFGKDTRKSVTKVDSNFAYPRKMNSVFIPANEVISRYQIILKSREQDRVFGFDETEYSLVKIMQFPSSAELEGVSAEVVEKLRKFDGGFLNYSKNDNVWKFTNGKNEVPIGILSEGVRKMSVVERLLAANYIKPGSIVIIDEIENSLHPQALKDFIDIIYLLSQNNVQFFISTHSYIALKLFYILARKKNESISVASIEENEIKCADLKDGLPENDIIKASNEIYEEEVDLMFG